MTDVLLRCGLCGCLVERAQLVNCERCGLLLCSAICKERHRCQ